MRAGELLEIAPRLADDAKHLAVERYLEDPPREGGFADKHHIAARRDAERIGLADHRFETLAGRRCAVHRMRSGNRRYIDAEHALELAVGVEDLDAPVRAVADIDVVVAIDRNGVGQVELPRPSALGAP